MACLYCFQIFSFAGGKHEKIFDYARFIITPAIALFSETLNFNFSLGYATTAINDIDNALQNIPNATGSVPAPNSGNYFAFEANYKLQNGFMIGPRIEFINTDMYTWQFGYYNDYTAALMPILIGVSNKYDYHEMTVLGYPGVPIFIKVGLYLGYALGSAYNNIKKNYPGTEMSVFYGSTIRTIETVSMNGSGFVAEALISFNCGFLALNIGYREAYIHQMTYSNNLSDSNLGIYVNKGAVVKDLNNKTLGFDFSGFIFGPAINIGF